MICSLNEIEALSRKAARGSGLSWGLAEETGKAVRWLSDNGLPGPRVLVELLCLNDGVSHADVAPRCENGVWTARNGALSPIVAGALICDRAEELMTGEGLRLEDIAAPLLLAPFVSAASRAAGLALALEWPGVVLSFDRGAVAVEGDEAALLAGRAKSVILTTGVRHATRSARGRDGRDVAPQTTRLLESFAQRTYAPATELSRAGAGAGRDAD